MSRRETTVTRSFRVDETVVHRIEEEARARGVSPNILVNTLLTRFINFDRFDGELRRLHVARGTMIELLSLVRDERLVELGRQSARRVIASRVIDAATGGSSTENAIDYLKSWSSANAIRLTDSTVQGVRRVSCFTQLGCKWPIVLASMWGAIFSWAGASPKIFTEDDVILFEFRVT